MFCVQCGSPVARAAQTWEVPARTEPHEPAVSSGTYVASPGTGSSAPETSGHDTISLPEQPGGGRRSVTPPTADTDLKPRSRRALISTLTAAAVVLIAGAGAAAALLLHHHHAGSNATKLRTPAVTHAAVATPTTRPSPTATPSVTVSPSASTATVGPANWTYPRAIDQQAYQNDQATIASVSCVSATRCFAVDTDGNVLASNASGSWQKVAFDSQTNLASISCPTTRFCAAVDNSGDVIVLTSGTWTDPVRIDSGNSLTGISCSSPSFCVAVDNAGNALTFTGSVTNWSQAGVAQGNSLASVSCPTANFCVAVDQYGNAYTYQGGTWSAGTNIDNSNGLIEVSCPSAAFLRRHRQQRQ